MLGTDPNVYCLSENSPYSGMTPLTLLFQHHTINKKVVKLLLEQGSIPNGIEYENSRLLPNATLLGENPDREDIKETIKIFTVFWRNMNHKLVVFSSV